RRFGRPDRLKPTDGAGPTPIYKIVTMWSNATLSTEDCRMPRLAQDVIVVSEPVRTFPNGDYFYIELSRRHNRYDCLLKMARDGNPSKSVIVVRSQGKTIREAEDYCFRKALECYPRFPRPHYL